MPAKPCLRLSICVLLLWCIYISFTTYPATITSICEKKDARKEVQGHSPQIFDKNDARRHSRGFLYIAMGEKYILDACLSAESLREALAPLSDASRHRAEELNAHDFGVVNITLVSSAESIGFLNKFPRARALFDVVIEMPADPHSHAYLKKVKGFRMSPYDITLFLDADTTVCLGPATKTNITASDDAFLPKSQFSNAFYEMRFFSLAGAHAPHLGDADRGRPVFTPINTGVVFFRNPRIDKTVAKMFEKWERTLAERPAGSVSDQPIFRMVREEDEFRYTTMVLPPEWNCRRGRDVGCDVPLEHVTIPTKAYCLIDHFHYAEDEVRSRFSVKFGENQSLSVVQDGI